MSVLETQDKVENIEELMQEMGAGARRAASILATAPADQKNKALKSAAESLRASQRIIMDANALDMEFGRSRRLSDSMMDRLMLDEERIEAMAAGIEAIVELPDPVGTTIAEWDRPNGLHIARVRVPLGVIGIIYESRPNVTADAGALCLKSGNASILRAGSESLHSSHAIHHCLVAGLTAAGLPAEAINLVPTRDRAAVGEMLTMSGLIDIVVPRGGKGLIERVQSESRVPVMAHLEGICHVYIHKDADIQKAVAITVNAKMRRPGICGAAETLLVDRAIVGSALPKLIIALIEAGCEVRGDKASMEADQRVKAATEDDWYTEYLEPIISVRVVDDIAAAKAHIIKYGSSHTECIVTENQAAADEFLTEVDSAIVMHNASTQYADGGEFGMGAEIGISTGRLHARGPVGLEQLTTFKYVVRGNGQVRP